MRKICITLPIGLLAACASPDGSEATNRPDRIWDRPGSDQQDSAAIVDSVYWEDTATTEDDCPVGLNDGQCAPDFTLTSSRDTSVSLSDFKGKRIIIVGSATW